MEKGRRSLDGSIYGIFENIYIYMWNCRGFVCGFDQYPPTVASNSRVFVLVRFGIIGLRAQSNMNRIVFLELI